MKTTKSSVLKTCNILEEVATQVFTALLNKVMRIYRHTKQVWKKSHLFDYLRSGFETISFIFRNVAKFSFLENL